MTDLRDYTGMHAKGGLWLSMGWIVAFLVLLGMSLLNYQYSGSQFENIKAQILSVRTQMDVLSSRIDLLESNLARGSSKTATNAQAIQVLQDAMSATESRLHAIEAPKKKTTKRGG